MKTTLFLFLCLTLCGRAQTPPEMAAACGYPIVAYTTATSPPTITTSTGIPLPPDVLAWAQACIAAGTVSPYTPPPK